MKQTPNIIKKLGSNARAFLLWIASLGLLLLGQGAPVGAADLTSSSLSLSDSRTGQTNVTYDFQASNVTTSPIKCIKLVFADTATGSTVPTGMDTTGAAFDGTSDYVPTPGSWTVDATTNGTVEITFATGETPASASARNVVLTGIDNGSTANDDYFLQFSTYNNTDCSSSAVDDVTVNFIFTSGQAVELTVDPSLSFTVAAKNSGTSCNSATTNVTTTATTVPLGTVTTSTNAIAAQDLTVTTNAGNGYTTYSRYTAQPTSGSNTIDDHSGTNASPSAFSGAGTEAFGYTTSDSTLSVTGDGADRFTNPGNEWAAFTTTNAEVAYSAAAVSSDTVCMGYQAGISGTTPAGTYQTTVIHTATPIY